MSNRYAALPNDNPRSTRNQPSAELDAAFDSDDEDATENQPLTQVRSGAHTVTHQQQQPTPGAYDFETTEFDWTRRPPPGSPPPNPFGNTNGIVPSFSLDNSMSHRPGSSWLSRTAASVVPTRYLRRIGLAPQIPSGAVGGGLNNDGVFANVTAKPAPPVRVVEGDDTFIVPEDARAEAPPSYATAQADAVPPYWETTIHAPFAGGGMGTDILIDSLPVGSIFAFLWNSLVSISFQFVGFLLTYLLHSSHASRLGSRAGLGVTLIQYGFALRSKIESNETDPWGWNAPSEVAPAGAPTFATAAEADAWHQAMGTNSTMSGVPEDPMGSMFNDAATEWLSFLLMTIGWFVLLTSVLGFYRVKRWEGGIRASQEGPVSTAPTPAAPSGTPRFGLERAFALGGIAPGQFFRQGFGFREAEPQHDSDDDDVDIETGHAENDPMLPHQPSSASDTDAQTRVAANEARLQRDLRAAGLL